MEDILNVRLHVCEMEPTNFEIPYFDGVIRYDDESVPNSCGESTLTLTGKHFDVFMTLRDLHELDSYSLQIVTDTLLLPWDHPRSQKRVDGGPQAVIRRIGRTMAGFIDDPLVPDLSSALGGRTVWQHPLDLADEAGDALWAYRNHRGFYADLLGLLASVVHTGYFLYKEYQKKK